MEEYPDKEELAQKSLTSCQWKPYRLCYQITPKGEDTVVHLKSGLMRDVSDRRLTDRFHI